MAKQIAQSLSGGTEITMERLGVELENGLEKDTIYVSDCDSGRTMNPFMSWGGADKTYIATGPNILGWGVAAGFGAKLARPDRPVVVRRRRRQHAVRRPAAAVEPVALQGAGHEHRPQQPQLQ